jgi:anti-sigma factor ChrR (cupin superfamily)
MKLNADFSEAAVVHAARMDWSGSPVAGVERRMLDRIGAEVARATSIVRYAPASQFPPHIHGGGEEFLVLDGVFQDQHGDYPAGYYVRNPPQSRHTPGSQPGCVIFVKLWQFDPDDRSHVIIDSHKMAWLAAGRAGVEILPLFKDRDEDVRLERWAADTDIKLAADGGLELLVLDGSFRYHDETFDQYSWLRLPAGDTFTATAAGSGCRLWLKTGHLRPHLIERAQTLIS